MHLFYSEPTFFVRFNENLREWFSWLVGTKVVVAIAVVVGIIAVIISWVDHKLLR